MSDPLRARLTQLIADMQRVDVQVDEADNATNYQLCMIALALVARQLLREPKVLALLADAPLDIADDRSAPLSNVAQTIAEMRSAVQLSAQFSTPVADAQLITDWSNQLEAAPPASWRAYVQHKAVQHKATLELAKRIANLAHAGQREESTGDSYIHHVERVVALVEGDEAQAVAWLHDVVEDNEWWRSCEDPESWLRALVMNDAIVDAVLRLTRGWHVAKSESYRDYIEDIRASGDRLAIAVKIADLRDHLRPNCPESLRPRYEHALTQLEAALLAPASSETEKQ